MICLDALASGLATSVLGQAQTDLKAPASPNRMIAKCSVQCAFAPRGKALRGWRVFPLDLANIQDVRYSQQQHRLTARAQPSAAKDGPIIYRGEFHLDADTVRGPTGHLPDTYIGLRQWSKGLAFINGFNLGWYWPRLGPQGAQYVPGPLLKAGLNEIILVEVEDAPVKGDSKHNPSVHLTDSADFAGANQDFQTASAYGKQ